MPTSSSTSVMGTNRPRTGVRSAHVETKTMPSRRVTRHISRTAPVRSGKNCRPCWQRTVSKLPSGNPVAAAEDSRYSIGAHADRQACSPRRQAAQRRSLTYDRPSGPRPRPQTRQRARTRRYVEHRASSCQGRPADKFASPRLEQLNCHETVVGLRDGPAVKPWLRSSLIATPLAFNLSSPTTIEGQNRAFGKWRAPHSEDPTANRVGDPDAAGLMASVAFCLAVLVAADTRCPPEQASFSRASRGGWPVWSWPRRPPSPLASG